MDAFKGAVVRSPVFWEGDSPEFCRRTDASRTMENRCGKQPGMFVVPLQWHPSETSLYILST
jgi:hypothetical protein